MSMFYKNNQPLGTLSSGGHTILNKLKQALTQRTKLMFGGGLKATDNSQDGITLVDDSADEIEFSDWIAKTEEEKEEYAEEHAKFDIINAPGVDELVELKLLTKLWENPAPTASFAAQTITLASDDYDFLLLISKRAISTNATYSDIFCKTYSGCVCHTSPSSTGDMFYRLYTYVDDTHYSISDCTYQLMKTAAQQTWNNGVIPIVIYGFKTNIKSIISAIASDVSTSASKCMLPDGETSVADALTYGFVKVEPNGTKTNAQGLNELFALIDFNKVTAKSILQKGTGYFNLYTAASNAIVMNTAAINSNNTINVYQFTIKSTGSTLERLVNGVYTNLSSDVLNGDLIFYY